MSFGATNQPLEGWVHENMEPILEDGHGFLGMVEDGLEKTHAAVFGFGVRITRFQTGFHVGQGLSDGFG